MFNRCLFIKHNIVVESVFYAVLTICYLGSRLDEKLTPATLTDADMKGNAIFDIPIVVIPGI